MKIGIITQPLASNYGGILQNWALQQVLKRMGHTPITLRCRVMPQYRYYLAFMKVLFLYSLGRITTLPPLPWRYLRQNRGMRHFINKHINSISRLGDYDSSVLGQQKINFLIVGSDQVWRPCYNIPIENKFFGWVEDYSIPRIAYAASFGVSEWEFSAEQEMNCRALLNNFKAVSVREKSGVNLCATHLDCSDAQWVLDPTLLLEKDAYANLCKHIPIRECVFVYMLDYDSTILELAHKVAEKYGCELLVKQAHDHLVSTDSPEVWLALFRDAQFVITDSFHGTVFSIIFQKEFLTFRNEGRGNTRMDSLMEVVGLHDRLVTSNTASLPISSIDWEILQRRLSIKQQESMDFLVKNCNL
ncbi:MULTISPECIES: polysaccharide pyruvyl transferase family protein [Bacteroides]|uniref:polysaccharide pyruvyl transferase family protein n=1 Tax=Bacteroides TaxID=816 RepID=UPI0030155B52